ncbi:MAG: hypothetical protein P4L69_16590 [Desulfosporosinus sp.]|nr:hypothetical protein [Desulfosporosinus sp.]
MEVGFISIIVIVAVFRIVFVNYFMRQKQASTGQEDKNIFELLALPSYQ